MAVLIGLMKRFCFRACKLHFDYLGGLGRDVIGNACWAHFIYFLIDKHLFESKIDTLTVLANALLSA
jgi:hypothetical protein